MYTQIVGDPNFPPTIQPCSDFGPNYVLDGFPNTNGSYWNGGNASLNFYKSIRNVNIDTTKVDPSVNVKCLNWAVSQATSIKYMTFIMAKNGLHQGIESQGSLDPTIMHQRQYWRLGNNVWRPHFQERKHVFDY